MVEQKEHIYGNKHGRVGFHHIGEYELNGEKLKDLVVNLQIQIDLLKKDNKILAQQVRNQARKKGERVDQK